MHSWVEKERKRKTKERKDKQDKCYIFNFTRKIIKKMEVKFTKHEGLKKYIFFFKTKEDIKYTLF